MHKFNVFGTLMSVHRHQNEWLLFVESGTGMRRRVYDVVIPAELHSEQLCSYLDDIFHEQASQHNPTVTRI
ncbi:hypothetical protein [Shewanella waksmanii]|uniref:DUF7661 family protein n=1 Tax=Shewanella waksmanii TaxID=213783 RepID=UPI00373618A9